MSGGPPGGPYGSYNPSHMMGYMPQNGVPQYHSNSTLVGATSMPPMQQQHQHFQQQQQHYSNTHLNTHHASSGSAAAMGGQHEHVLQILKSYPKAGYENVYDVQLAGYPHPMQVSHWSITSHIAIKLHESTKINTTTLGVLHSRLQSLIGFAPARLLGPKLPMSSTRLSSGATLRSDRSYFRHESITSLSPQLSPSVKYSLTCLHFQCLFVIRHIIFRPSSALTLNS